MGIQLDVGSVWPASNPAIKSWHRPGITLAQKTMSFSSGEKAAQYKFHWGCDSNDVRVPNCVSNKSTLRNSVPAIASAYRPLAEMSQNRIQPEQTTPGAEERYS